MAAPIIALVFDFDDTLAPDSTSSFLETLGFVPREFWSEHAKLLAQGHDPIPAYLEMILAHSRTLPVRGRVTQKRLQAFGKGLKTHPGVRPFLERVRKQVEARGAKAEFYVISSGIGEIIRSCPMASEFTDIFASDYSYRSGEIDGLKNIVSFTDKTRFLFQVSKGIVGAKARKDPFAVNQKVASASLRIPFDRMVMIGDGLTDVPCFSLVQKNGGIPIGVYDRESRERWGKAWGFIEDSRVKHLVAADYHKRSGLDDAVSLAIETIAGRISLKAVTFQE